MFLSLIKNIKYITAFNESKIQWKLVKCLIELVDNNLK